VVVPGQHAPAADRADGRRAQYGGGGLVYPTLRVGERDHLRAAEVLPQQVDQLLHGTALGWLEAQLPGEGLGAALLGYPDRRGVAHLVLGAAQQGPVQDRTPAGTGRGRVPAGLAMLHARPPTARQPGTNSRAYSPTSGSTSAPAVRLVRRTASG